MKKNFQQVHNPDSYIWQIRIEIAAHLDSWMADCFYGLNIEHREDGITVLAGSLADLPAFYGLMLQMRDTRVELLSLQVKRVSKNETGHQP